MANINVNISYNPSTNTWSQDLGDKIQVNDQGANPIRWGIALAPGATVIVMATCAPARIADIAVRVAASGRHFVDAPVSGGVVGAQYGAVLATRLKPDLLRFALAVIILLVALRMLLGLAWQPDEIFSVEYL